VPYQIHLTYQDNDRKRVMLISEWAGLIFTPGRYEFKFLVDGKWCVGSKKVQTVPNCFGTFNHVLIVPEKGE